MQDEPFKKVIERLDRMGSTPDFYSGGPGFKSQPGDRLSWPILTEVSLQCLHENTKILSKITPLSLFLSQLPFDAIKVQSEI